MEAHSINKMNVSVLFLFTHTKKKIRKVKTNEKKRKRRRQHNFFFSCTSSYMYIHIVHVCILKRSTSYEQAVDVSGDIGRKLMHVNVGPETFICM